MIKDGQSDEPSSKTDWPAMLFLVVALSTALIYGGIWIGLVTFAVGMILYQRNVVGREPEEARKKCNALEARVTIVLNRCVHHVQGNMPLSHVIRKNPGGYGINGRHLSAVTNTYERC